MAAAEQKSFHSFLDRRLSRREAIMRGIVFLGGIGSFAAHEYGNQFLFDTADAYKAYKEFTKGFHEVSPDLKQQLIGDIEATSFNSSSEFIASSQGNYQEISFTVAKPSLVLAKFHGQKDPNISLPVVEVEYAGYQYQVPILQTRDSCTQQVLFTNVKPDNPFIIKGTNASGKLSPSDVSVDLSLITSKRPFATNLLSCIPKIGMRIDNLLTNNITNDMPYFLDVRFQENDEGVILTEFWQGYTSEDGGSSDEELYARTKRLFDYDLVLAVKTNRDGEVYEVVHQEDKFFNPHQIITDFRSTVPVNPRDERLQRLFFLQSVPNHGLVHPGLETYSYNGRTEPIKKIFTSYPDFYPWTDSQLYENHAREIIALRERISEVTEALNSSGDSYITNAYAGNGQFATLAFLQKRLEEEMKKKL